MRPLLLLGPQRPEPNLCEALKTWGPTVNRVAVLTAGWRGDEGEDHALRAHLGPALVDGGYTSIPLYRWFEGVGLDAPELVAAWSQRQERHRTLKRLHRVRHAAALEALATLEEEAKADAHGLARGVADDALAAVRRLDEDLLGASDRIDADVAELQAPWTHPKVAPYHDRLRDSLDSADALLLAGGHVAVLLNRLRFFGVEAALRERADLPVAAWSAGLMALTERVVLFYDDPPEGVAWPELFGRGLGLVPGLVALPHARRRLRLGDRRRVALLARRWAPASCIGFENGAVWVGSSEGGLTPLGAVGSSVTLGLDGSVTDVGRVP